MNIRLSLPLEAWVDILESLETLSAAISDEIEDDDFDYSVEEIEQLIKFQVSIRSTVKRINDGVGDVKLLAKPRKGPIRVTSSRKN